MPNTSVTTVPALCETCGKTLPPPMRKNRLRRFCNSACRSKAYWDREEADMRAALVHLGRIRDSFDELERALVVRTTRKTISKHAA